MVLHERDSLTYERFIERFPRLYHLAYAENWPLIQQHGLLSTQSLLELFLVSPEEREALLSQRRAQSVKIRHPEHGWEATVRDQHPLNEKKLRGCLVEMEPAEWYRLLNGRVFFWPTSDRLEGMRKAYNGVPSVLLEFDTRRLVERYGPDIELSRINSGSTGRYAAAPRGRDTFVSLADYKDSEVAEITVRDRVSPLADILLSFEIINGPDPIRGY